MKVSNYKTKLVGKRKFYLASPYQRLIDKKVHLELKGKYNLKNKNRDYIIDALITSISNKKLQLTHNSSQTIIRCDIKKFFESINKHKLYQRLNRSMMLKERSLNKIKEIVFTRQIKGIPQGVSFSSSLSEIYLEDFDKVIPAIMPNLILYERFVDDIIIVLNGDHELKVDSLIKNINFHLSQIKLELNNKTQIEILNKQRKFEFSYLGYTIKSNGNERELIISINQEKIKKYSDNISQLFSIYFFSERNNENFYKLFYLLRNLLWATETKDYLLNKTITFGFKHSYKRINEFESFNIINKQLSKHINSSNIFNRNQKRMLYSLKLSQKKQIYNFNNASLKQLIIISENLDISIVTDITKEKLIKNIFKALY